MASEKIRCMSIWMSYGESVAFVLAAGVGAVINARGLATIGDRMSRTETLIHGAQKNLQLADIADGENPVILGDYRNEQQPATGVTIVISLTAKAGRRQEEEERIWLRVFAPSL